MRNYQIKSLIGLAALLLAVAGCSHKKDVSKEVSKESGSYGGTASRSSESGTSEQAGADTGSRDVGILRDIQNNVALNKIHHLNQHEIELAKLAESQAQSDDVKNLASRIRSDHEQLDQRVKDVAKRRNVSLEGYRAADYEVVAKDQLKKLEGRDFDETFLRFTQRGHEMTVTELRMMRRNMQDPDIRTLISDALPSIRAHDVASKELGRNLNKASEEQDNLGQ